MGKFTINGDEHHCYVELPEGIPSSSLCDSYQGVFLYQGVPDLGAWNNH